MCGKLCMCMQVWDFATGEVLRTLEGHSGTVRSLTISPDGRRVTSTSDDRTVKVVVLAFWRTEVDDTWCDYRLWW